MVAVIDLDRFKQVNDSLGHAAGDELLITAAARLTAAVCAEATTARLGGDEFAVLLPALPVGAPLETVGERLRAALAEAIHIAGRELHAHASIGIAATEPRAQTTADQLLRDADTAMYAAKSAGKDAFRVFEPAVRDAWLEQLEIRHALHGAVAAGVLDVAYQPIIDAATGRVVALEALARWTDPIRGVIAPDVFIPIAEESDLIVALGRTVLRRACERIAAWRCAFPALDVGVAVNVSKRQLEDASFANDVHAALIGNGLAPSALTIEITESAVAPGSSTHADPVLGSLRALGVRTAIDDFGTGQSSLAALVRRPVDTLKIDRQFVDALSTDDRGSAVVRAIVQIAGTLGLATTAEGVETADQAETLRLLGCTYLQGYLIARPMTADHTTAPGGAARPASTSASTSWPRP